MSQPLNPFERLLRDMLQDSGQGKSPTVPPAPADSEDTQSGRQNATGTPSSPWPGVVMVALILGFLFAVAWLVISHVG